MKMKTELKRREFVTTCFKAGVACCAIGYGNSLQAQDPAKQEVKKPDPKSLNYCGFKCTTECTLYKASLENNVELKKKAYAEFKIKEKYGIDFDPDKIFCFGCKEKNKPLSVIVSPCTVRKCAIEKGYECCIECNGLAACDKELWKSFPQFKENVIKMQKIYQGA
jgi:hypothetical protein